MQRLPLAMLLVADLLLLSGGGVVTTAPNGVPVAWGDNNWSQLSSGCATASCPSPVQVVGPPGTGTLSGVKAIEGGLYNSLALKTDGTVWTWGANDAGQLGNNRQADSDVPVQVVGPGEAGALSGVKAIDAGSEYSLALKEDGTVWAWGENSNCQLGNNTTTDSRVPVQVSGLSGVTNIATGGSHSLALTTDSGSQPAPQPGLQPPPSTYSISGTVRNQNGKTLRGARHQELQQARHNQQQ